MFSFLTRCWDGARRLEEVLGALRGGLETIMGPGPAEGREEEEAPAGTERPKGQKPKARSQEEAEEPTKEGYLGLEARGRKGRVEVYSSTSCQLIQFGPRKMHS